MVGSDGRANWRDEHAAQPRAVLMHLGHSAVLSFATATSAYPTRGSRKVLGRTPSLHPCPHRPRCPP